MMNYYVDHPTATYQLVDASQLVFYTPGVPYSMDHVNLNPQSIPTNSLVSYSNGGIQHPQILSTEEYAANGFIMVWNPQQIYSPPTYALQDSGQYSLAQAGMMPNAVPYGASASVSGHEVSSMSISSGTASNMVSSVWNPQQIYSTTYAPQDSIQYSPDQAETASNEESSFEASSSQSGREVSPMSISSGTASNMANSESEHETGDVRRVHAKATSLRNRNLRLTLQLDDQLPVENLRNKFVLEFKTCKIEKIDEVSLDERLGIYDVRFESIMMAQYALLLARGLGYETTSQCGRFPHSLLPKRLKRPSPQRVCPFKVLAKKLTVREKRSLESNIIKTETENNVVFVDRIKGRRARLVQWLDGCVRVGWASLFSKAGIPLMEQLE